MSTTNKIPAGVSLNEPEPAYMACINQGRIEFERALESLTTTHTWQEILQLMTDNESDHHD